MYILSFSCKAQCFHYTIHCTATNYHVKRLEQVLARITQNLLVAILGSQTVGPGFQPQKTTKQKCRVHSMLINPVHSMLINPKKKESAKAKSEVVS